MNEVQKELRAQIEARSKEIATDAYAMSVGEIFSIYQDNEIDIHPEFQRFFRWSNLQRSKFVESILLGIPLPSIFVAQRDDGAWDLIDGLQRVSTLLQLAGELKDENGSPVAPLALLKTNYLPALEGMTWEGPNALPSSAKLRIRRARIDLKIVLNTSDPSAKYELFQRLNTGGSIATDQEVRNCLLIMINKPVFEFVNELSQFPAFRETVPLSERQLIERYDLELICRFIILRRIDEAKIRDIRDLGEFLTTSLRDLAQQNTINFETERAAFQNTFTVLNDALGDDAFKKFDVQKARVQGAFLISLFETLALGIGHWAEDANYICGAERIREVHRSLWGNPDFQRRTGSGIGASQRIPFTIPAGRRLFSP